METRQGAQLADTPAVDITLPPGDDTLPSSL
jgi:hypothetical protein